ncbi:MAG: patatin-like phospholipase family protein, partial [Nocardia sp.]|nr:patatin-like phospholipase family protein [Nocardia sp.]
GDPIEVDQLRLGQVFATLAEKGDELDKRRRVGQLALAADAGEPDAHIHRIAALAGVAEWPDADLQITSVDTDSGALQVWTRHTAATLAQALASSTSVPGVFPPIPIGQSRYMDGGMRSAINADLAAGADTVIIMEPLAHLFPRQRSDREHGAATEISIVPDAETIAVFGADMFSPTVLPAAYQAGIRQAGDAAPGLTGHGLDS